MSDDVITSVLPTRATITIEMTDKTYRYELPLIKEAQVTFKDGGPEYDPFEEFHRIKRNSEVAKLIFDFTLLKNYEEGGTFYTMFVEEKNLIKTKKFEKKQTPIEAVQITDKNWESVTVWCNGKLVEADPDFSGQMKHIEIRTDDGVTGSLWTAYVGWWVILEGDGSFKTVNPHEFQELYREVKSE